MIDWQFFLRSRHTNSAASWFFRVINQLEANEVKTRWTKDEKYSYKSKLDAIQKPFVHGRLDRSIQRRWKRLGPWFELFYLHEVIKFNEMMFAIFIVFYLWRAEKRKNPLCLSLESYREWREKNTNSCFSDAIEL